MGNHSGIREDLRDDGTAVQPADGLRQAWEPDGREFAAIGDRTEVGFLVVDSRHRVSWSNAAFRTRFSRDPDQAGTEVGRSCHQVLCGKPEPCAECPVVRSLRTGEPARHELRMWIRDRYHAVYATSIPIPSENGEIDSVLLLLIDVSELEVLEQSEEAFRSSEQRFRSVFECAPAGMATFKIDGSFLQVNPAFCTMLGYTSSELLRMTIDDVTHPDDRQSPPDRTPTTSAAGLEAEERERRYLRRDGTELWGLTTTVTQRDRKQRPTHVVALVQNITESRTAQQQLAQSQSNFETLVNSIDGVVWEADPHSMKYSFVSEQAEEMLGFPRDRWLTQPRFWRNQIHPEDLDRVLPTYSRAVLMRGSFELEYRVIAADGRVVWVRDRVNVTEASGGDVCMRGILTDISAYKTSREALEQSQEELRETQRTHAIGRLTGGFAHGLDDALKTIGARAGQLVQDLDRQHPLQDKVAEIIRTADAATELTGQLLALTRRQAPEPELLDPNAVVAGMEGMLRRVITENTVLVTAPGSSRGRVKADAAQLSQAILHLAIDARDAMPNGGQLRILTDDLRFDETSAGDVPGLRPGPYVKLTIQEFGHGTNAGATERLLDTSLDGHTSGSGRGAGLAVVELIVKQNEGLLRIVEHQDGITAFEIFLPSSELPDETVRSIPADADASLRSPIPANS